MDKGSAQEFYELIKKIVDNYMRCRKPACILVGQFNGSAVMLDTLPVPMSMISGNMKGKLTPGDKVRLLRNDGGREYYVLEIIGKPYQTGG